MIPDARANAPKHRGWWKGDQGQVGAWVYGYESLWLPQSLLHKNARKRLAQALFDSSRHQRVELHFNKGLAGAPPECVAAARQCATNPAVCEAFALAIIANGQGPVYPGYADAKPDVEAARKQAAQIDQAASTLRAIAPQAGSYVSESNYFNNDWEREFWGQNAKRLRSVKAKYDPSGLFFVHHGVGSELWSTDGFERMDAGTK